MCLYLQARPQKEWASGLVKNKGSCTHSPGFGESPPEAGGHSSPHGSPRAPQGLGSGCTGPRPLPDPATLDSFCKGRTLHSFVRDPKTSLDINKTRQIAQEIIKVKRRPPALSACVRGVVAALSLPLAQVP